MNERINARAVRMIKKFREKNKKNASKRQFLSYVIY